MNANVAGSSAVWPALFAFCQRRRSGYFLPCKLVAVLLCCACQPRDPGRFQPLWVPAAGCRLARLGDASAVLPMQQTLLPGAPDLSVNSVFAFRVGDLGNGIGTVLTACFSRWPCLAPYVKRLASAAAPCCWLFLPCWRAWGRGRGMQKRPVPQELEQAPRVPIRISCMPASLVQGMLFGGCSR